MKINSQRLLGNIDRLGKIGALSEGGVCRAALSVEDKVARDWLKEYVGKLGLDLGIDQAGNMFATLPGNESIEPVMTGSHLDTVYTGGLYDGSLGVLAGLEVIESLLEEGSTLRRPIILANFTNEEGVRFAPDMMGSLAFSFQSPIEQIWNSKAYQEEVTVKEALENIGYLGNRECGFFKPYSFIELHIEQGPVLEKEGLDIGVVEHLQGIYWTQYTIQGKAAHAGTTPLRMRKDSLLLASEMIMRVNDIAKKFDGVGTVGSLDTYPNAINIVAERTRLSVDLRNPDEHKLKQMQDALDDFVYSKEDNWQVHREELVRLGPVQFDPKIVDELEKQCNGLGLSYKRMVSGAGHDAQMISAICPTAMIFVPSVEGISHNIQEKTLDKDVINGTKLLKSAVLTLANS